MTATDTEQLGADIKVGDLIRVYERGRYLNIWVKAIGAHDDLVCVGGMDFLTGESVTCVDIGLLEPVTIRLSVDP